MTAPKNLKFGLLLVHHMSHFPKPDKSVQLTKEFALVGEGSVWIEAINDKFWREWLGSLMWDHVCGSEHLFLATKETETPDVDNNEDKNLRRKLEFAVHFGLLLLGPYAGSDGEIHVVTGTAELKNGNLIPGRPRGHSRLDGVVRPVYTNEKAYWKWAYENLNQEKCLVELGQITRQIRKIQNPRSDHPLRLALMFFRRAMTTTWGDFKFPYLVQAIEAVVAIPKPSKLREVYGKSATNGTVLADRCMKYYPNPRNLPFQMSRSKIRSMLVDIYDMRSDSAHGKPIGHKFRKVKKRNFRKGELARYEFVAETAARSLLREALSNQELRMTMRDRDSLEDAWLNNLF